MCVCECVTVCSCKGDGDADTPPAIPLPLPSSSHSLVPHSTPPVPHGMGRVPRGWARGKHLAGYALGWRGYRYANTEANAQPEPMLADNKPARKWWESRSTNGDKTEDNLCQGRRYYPRHVPTSQESLLVGIPTRWPRMALHIAETCSVYISLVLRRCSIHADLQTHSFQDHETNSHFHPQKEGSIPTFGTSLHSPTSMTSSSDSS